MVPVVLTILIAAAAWVGVSIPVALITSRYPEPPSGEEATP